MPLGTSAGVKRLIVHIGPRKTGSTSIQRALAACRGALAAERIHLPRAGSVPANRGTHIRLAHALRCDRAGLWQRLAEELRGARADCALLSVEDFAEPAHRSLAAARLAEFAADLQLEVRLLAYVRPQWQIIEAEYSQRVCGRGMAVPFDQFAAELLAAGSDTILDYNRVFAPFRAVFGPRLRVFTLAQAERSGGLVAHFLAQVGAAAHLARSGCGARANTRRGAREIEVRRLLCARLGGKAGMAMINRRLPELTARIGADAPFAGFDETMIDRLTTRFAEANRRFALDYGVEALPAQFRDAGHGSGRRDAGPRPNVARWEAFDADARRRIRRYVLQRSGIDLDGGRGRWAMRLWLQARWTLTRALRRQRRGGTGWPPFLRERA